MFLFLSELILISLLIDFANKVECCLIDVESKRSEYVRLLEAKLILFCALLSIIISFIEVINDAHSVFKSLKLSDLDLIPVSLKKLLLINHLYQIITHTIKQVLTYYVVMSIII